MGLIFKRPFTRQPQGVVQLDRSNPLTEAPGFVWVPQRNREIVSQLPWSKSGSTPPVISATPQGVSTLHTAGAATVSYVDLGAQAGPSADVGLNAPATYVGVFYASAASGVAIAERNDANAVDAGWVFGYIDGGNIGTTFGLGFLHENSGSNCSKSISNAVAPGLNVLVATFDGTQIATGINIYLNGVLGTVLGTQNGGGTAGSDAARNLYVGRNTFQSSHSHSGTILLAGAFRRLWSPAEVKQFSNNPWQIFAPSSRRLLLDVPASGTTVALTGVSATGSVGTVGVTVDKALTGNSGTGSVGTVVPTTSKALTGNSATGSVGTVAPSVSVALTGTTGTGSAGTVSPAVVVALTGVTGTGSVGTVTPVNGGTTVALTGVTGTGSVGTVSVAADKTLTGVSGTGSAGTVGPSIDKAITGNSATGSVGTVSPAASVALSGTSATGSPGTTAANVVVALSGVSATGSVGTVTAVQGGVSADLTGVSGTGSVGQPGVSVVVGLTGVTGTGSAGSVSVQGSGGGIDTWGSVYVRTKKKKKEPEAIPVAGPVVREFIEAAMQAHEPPSTKVAGRRVPAVIDDEDEEELWMLLL